MLRLPDRFLKSAGVVQSRLQYADTLDCGFIFGLWWKYEPIAPEGHGRLLNLLNRLGLMEDELRSLPSTREMIATIAVKLSQERSGLEHWFKLGMWTFANAWLLGVNRFADTTEAARELIRSDPEVRAAGSNLIGALLDIGWAPEECEDFYAQKMIPFLYDPGHRRWADDLSMAVMSDLRYKAQQLGAELAKDSDGSRAKGAFRALVSEIPVVGRSLEIMLFGSRK